MTVTLHPSTVRIAFGLGSALCKPEVRTEGSRTVIVLRGEADVATRPAISDVLADAIASCSGDVVIDLAAVEFVDSAIVRVLADTSRLLDSHGRRLIIRSPSRLASRVLDLFGIDDLIEPGTRP